MSDQEQDPQNSPNFPLESPVSPAESPAAEIIPPASIPPYSEASSFGALQIPADLNVPWSWSDLAVFLLFYFGITFVLSIVVVIGAAAAMRVTVNDLVNKHAVLFISLSILAQALASLASIFYLWAFAKLRGSRVQIQSSERPWQVLGWRSLVKAGENRSPIFRYIAGGVGLALGVSIVSQFVGQRGPVPFEELFKSRQTVLSLMAFGILIAPVVEEMMFRGFLYPVVARRFGIAAGIIFTGLLFGAFHAMQLWGAWEQIALLATVGLVLTWVRARSHSIFSSYLVHVSYNSTLFLGLFLATHGLRNFPAGK